MSWFFLFIGLVGLIIGFTHLAVTAASMSYPPKEDKTYGLDVVLVGLIIGSLFTILAFALNHWPRMMW